MSNGSGKLSKTAAYYAAFAALGLVGSSLGPTLPGLADNTHSLLSEISFLFTACWLGYLLGSFFGGRLYDRFPGHPLMAMALIAMAAMMSLVPLMSLLWLLTGILLLLGMAEGVLDVGGNALLVWVHRDSVGPFMNALHFFFGIGAFLSPVIIAQAVLIRGDSSWGYWALALLIIPVAVWLLRLTSPVTEADQDGALTLGRLLAIPIAAALPRQSIQFWQKPSICSIFLTGSCRDVRSAILLPHLQRMAAPAPSQLCLPVLRPQLQIRERHSRSLCVRIG